MIFSDSHVHTNFSSDGKATIEEQISGAISRGLKHLYITDHCDIDYPDVETGTVGEIFSLKPDTYFQTLLPFQKAFAGRLHIHIGVELGLRPEAHIVEKNQAFIESWPFDYCIGSVHVVDGFDPYYPQYWEAFGEEEGIRRYYRSMLESIQKFDQFDSLGHLDYIIRYAPSQGKDFAEDFFLKDVKEIFSWLISHEKSLELNTAGWKYQLPYPHPAPKLLEQYRRMGGTRITIGSDAHKPEHLAWDFTKVPAYLKSAGFEHYIRYENHEEIMVKL